MKKEQRKRVGKEKKIELHEKTRFAGILRNENGLFFLRPDDLKMRAGILIPEKSLNGGKDGQKAVAEVIRWNEPDGIPEGKIIKVVGNPGENDVEMRALALERGFESEIPRGVEAEAEKIKEVGIRASDYAGRRDFRKILTFTIDPDDAKDFDDAISFRILNSPLEEYPKGEVEKSSTPANGHPSRGESYEIGIHIADVSHYVRPGSGLDAEARERGTSVYLVDRTMPMLPEILSNDLCSLVPGKDRLTMSAVFTLDKNAKIKSQWFGATVIHSRKRFTYEEAERTIKEISLPFHRELAVLNGLAKKMRRQRFAEGAISLDQEEVKFVLDEKGAPLKVIKKAHGDANRLIEEFMLLANKRVAEVLSPKKNKGLNTDSVSIYRVHDLPNKEKMTDLAFFLQSLGHKIQMRGGIIPNEEINKLLEGLAGKGEADTVHRAVVRSMAKAIYSTKNIGHYGLAFQYYTHFTSPIRRYPDIMVHRLLKDYLVRKKIGREKLQEYESISRVASEQEQRAAEAERASVKYKQAEYMSSRVGETFEGVISGITEWGMYVEETETKCEGLIRLRDMEDDFYIFNEKRLELVGRRKKKKYRFGGRVRIKVKAVDLEKKTIDYVLA